MGTASDISRAVAAGPQPGAVFQALPATVGDHAEIEQFLSVVLQRPTPREFQAQLDDPYYEPTDRLIVKDHGQIVGHLRQTWRTMTFRDVHWSLGRFNDLGVLPEYRGKGVAEVLLAAAEREMQRQGTVMIECDVPVADAPQAAYWIAAGRRVASQASPRDILAQLEVRQDSARSGQVLVELGKRPLMSVCHWRHVELTALMRIYRANLASAYGQLERSEPYWRWLIGRGAFDQIFVAIEGCDRLSLDEEGCRIVGYAVVRDRQVLELMIEPDHPTAATLLLARACADAIERDWHTLRVHAPADSLLHEIVREAGGSFCRYKTARDQANLVHLSDPGVVVCQLGNQLAARAQSSGAELPLELGVSIDGVKELLVVSDQGVQRLEGKLGRSYVTMTPATWVRLLLGYDDGRSAVNAERIRSSTTLAAQMVAALFPPIPMWRPPWDAAPV